VAEKVDRGWVFCPEYTGAEPLEVSPDGAETRIFLFGPALLPDATSAVRNENGTSAESQPAEFGQATKTLGGPQGSSVGFSWPTAAFRQAVAGTGAAREGSWSKSWIDAEDPRRAGADADVGEPFVCLGTDLLTGSEVRWPLTVEGNPHLLIAGLPGMGKTTCLSNLCKQMLDRGVRPIVFSYHQDIDERLERWVRRHRRTRLKSDVSRPSRVKLSIFVKTLYQQ
jgi:hypothetical protein